MSVGDIAWAWLAKQYNVLRVKVFASSIVERVRNPS